MNENSIVPTRNSLVDLNLDKDTWIYTYGSANLQQVRSFGYDCQQQYLKERLKILNIQALTLILVPMQRD